VNDATRYCRVCGRPTEGRGVIRLWDGEAYCEACLQATCPAIVELSRRQDAFSEKEPLHIVAYLVASIPSVVLPGLFVLFMAGMHLVLHPGLMNSARFGLVLVVVLTLLFLRPVWSWLRQRTLSVHGGMLHVASRLESFSVPLRDCRWRKGPAREFFDNHGIHLWGLQKNSLLVCIDLPKEFGRFSTRRKFACGLDVWEGFFCLANVPIRPASLFAQARGLVFTVTVSVGVVGFAIGRVFGAMLEKWSGFAPIRDSASLVGLIFALFLTYDYFCGKDPVGPTRAHRWLNVILASSLAGVAAAFLMRSQNYAVYIFSVCACLLVGVIGAALIRLFLWRSRET